VFLKAEEKKLLTGVKWRKRPPDAAVSFVWKKRCGERAVSGNRHAKVCVLCAIVDEDLEFLLD
jgi:hypothetical protein